LQHGVTKDDIPALHFDRTGVQLFVCGARPEYDYICEEFGYPSGAVQYTGFARYDTLHDAKTKHQILIMPTWRKYISNENDFLESEFYRQWDQVLQSKRLAEYLEENDLSVIFYPHYEMQKYLHLFHPGSERIMLADFANYDVQTLLKESKLLVTDYSSVFFDFAYMRKPVVYFQFDQEEFFAKHYNRGYFSYQTMGFGPVTECVDATVDAMIQSTESGFLPTDEYQNRMEAFYPLYDRKNCERIYDAICSL
jgi:CDP-glycerol glycerophosphotransferase (TagB/SpsB family)